MPTPAAEIHTDEDLVRRLLTRQRPDLAALPVRIVTNGWDNVIARAGEEWAVRLPRRVLGARLLENELRWLPELAARLPLPVPAPVFAGEPEPGEGYPWRWSIARWLPGTVAALAPPEDAAEAARTLAGFLTALHQPAPAEAPQNAFRGVPLAGRDGSVRKTLRTLCDEKVLADGAGAPGHGHEDGDPIADPEKILTLWQSLRDTPLWPGPPVWLHGDLHPCNLLTHGGRLSAVIDFGDLTAGDPATDIAIAWMLFDAPAREIFRRSLTVSDDDTWRRAAGWALNLSLVYLTADAHTPLPATGRATLRAVMAGCGED